MLTGYILVSSVRRYQISTIDDIEYDTKAQIINIAFLMPIYFIHTYFGGEEFYKADANECGVLYSAQLLYMVIFMVACCQCFIFVILLLCIMIPVWIRKFGDRHRRAQI